MATATAKEAVTRTLKHRHDIYRLADLLGVFRIDRQNALTRRLVKKQMDGTLGHPAENDDEEEEMGHVSFGDQQITNNHYHRTSSSLMAKLTLAIILVALAAGGCYLAHKYLLPPVAEDCDTLFDLEFVD